MISQMAVVETEEVGRSVTIHEFAVVRSNVKLGDNVVIHPHVVIESGVSIDDGVEVFPGSVIGKRPRGAGSVARPIDYVERVTIGDDCAIGPNAVIYYDVEIGHNTLVGDGASLREQVRVGHHCIVSRYVTINYATIIGNRTKIMDLTHITGNCLIGDNVFIGVLVSTTNDNQLTWRKYDEEEAKGPTILNDANIGSGATVLPAVVIGEGAFVGAGAVVTRDVSPYDLVMGVPAKVVRNLKG